MPFSNKYFYPLYLSYKKQLNQELKVHKHSIVNINPDMTQSVLSGICLKSYNLINSQSISIFQESDSGCFSFATKKQLLSHRNQSDIFDFYITIYGRKFSVVIYTRS